MQKPNNDSVRVEGWENSLHSVTTRGCSDSGCFLCRTSRRRRRRNERAQGAEQRSAQRPRRRPNSQRRPTPRPAGNNPPPRKPRHPKVREISNSFCKRVWWRGPKGNPGKGVRDAGRRTLKRWRVLVQWVVAMGVGCQRSISTHSPPLHLVKALECECEHRGQ